MSTIAPVHPETENTTDPDIDTGIVVDDEDAGPRNMACPVCGSGSTYQTQSGRWGCVQCGSQWG